MHNVYAYMYVCMHYACTDKDNLKHNASRHIYSLDRCIMNQ